MSQLQTVQHRVPHLAVVGAGSLGLLVGGLVSAGNECRVTVVGRPQQVDAIRAAGLRIIEADGSLRHADASALSAVSHVGAITGFVDFALIATKRYDLDRALDEIGSIRRRIGTVFFLQNGIGHDQLIAERLGAARVIGALTMEGASIVEPGVVQHLLQSVTYIGELEGKGSDRAHTLIRLLNSGGLRTELSSDIQSAQWTKFVQSCAASGVCAVTRRGYAPATATEAGARLYVRLIKEGSAVMEASGMMPGRLFPEAALVAEIARLPSDAAVKLVRELATRLLSSGYSGATSLARDLQLGRRSENDALLGTMCQLAAGGRVPAPTMETVFLAIQATEDSRP